MAQNITLLGTSYSNVPSVDLPKTGGGTASFTDVTDTTAIASDVAEGKYFFTASGVLTLGTASGGDVPVWQGSDNYVYFSDTVPPPYEISMDAQGYVVIDIPESNEFVVTLSYDSSTDKWMPDCTHRELFDANEDGKTITVHTDVDARIATADGNYIQDVPHSIEEGWLNYTVCERDSTDVNRIKRTNYLFNYYDGVTKENTTTFSKGFVVTVSYNSSSGMWTPDKTFQDIFNAYEQQMPISVRTNISSQEASADGTFFQDTPHDIYDSWFDICVCEINDRGNPYSIKKIWYTLDVVEYRKIEENTAIIPSGTLYCDDSGSWNVTNTQTFVVPAGTAGTPTATKGTVSNHSVSVTPSVTNSEGWISNSTKTGTAVTVSASELVSGTKSITTNGTSDVTNYASVNVNVGGSSYTPISVGVLEVTANVTSTSVTTITTSLTIDTSALTNSKMLYVKVRDKAGKRNGYFYGTDIFFPIWDSVGGGTTQDPAKQVYRISTGGSIGTYSPAGATCYGVYVSGITDTGNVYVMGRYNSSYSGTINGTYSIDVYMLEWPGDISPMV